MYEATSLDDNRQYACKSISKAKLVTKVGQTFIVLHHGVPEIS